MERSLGPLNVGPQEESFGEQKKQRRAPNSQRLGASEQEANRKQLARKQLAKQPKNHQMILRGHRLEGPSRSLSLFAKAARPVIGSRARQEQRPNGQLVRTVMGTDERNNNRSSLNNITGLDQWKFGNSGRPASPRWAAALVVGGLLALSFGQARAQCPEKTMTSFERVGGVTIKEAGVPLGVLYKANVSGSASASAGSAATPPITPITAECNNRCRRSRTCRAFLVDYSRHICWSVEQLPGAQGGSSGGGFQAGGGLARAPQPIHLAPTSERTAYFEKVCLGVAQLDCERAWIYERVLAYQLHGHDDKIVDEVPSRLKCQELCLAERQFACRSGEYDYLTMQCRLSASDRHSKPGLFRPTSSNIDYFENQCLPIGSQCDAFERFNELDLGRAEIMRHANTSDQCQQFCTQTIKAFICRSFTWSPLTGRCYLNSANTQMIGGVDKLVPAPGLVYYQRNECIDLKLECDTASMTLNLRTSEPFRGRMYVRDEPNACETLGRSSLVSSLSIPFQSQARCAARELPSRYSSVVVVQQHPLIQRKSDRYIKLVCDFQTSNKTIMSSYNVLSNPWTSTALINATSFAPKIRLRITDKFGNDITGAKLGDELQLRIEAESETVYDMVARSVLARSGTTDESIVLIDHEGCPADYRIFPPLKKINKRTIIGRFDAFKFSSDVVVRFQVDVQFCLNSCPAPNCPAGNQLEGQLLQAMSSGQQQSAADQQASSPNADPQPDSPTPPTLFNLNTQQLPADQLGPGGQSLGSLGTTRATSTSTSTTSAPLAPLDGEGSAAGATPTHVLAHDSPAALDQNTVLAGAGRPASLFGGAQSERRPPANQPLSSGGAPSASASGPAGGQLSSLLAADAGELAAMTTGQNFDSSNQLQPQQQARRAPGAGPHQFGPPRRAAQAELGALEMAQSMGQTISHQQEEQGAQGARRRRRRAAETLPSEPRHVPLQREIIVLESSAGGRKSGEQQGATGRRPEGAGEQAAGNKERREGEAGRELSARTQQARGARSKQAAGKCH